MAATNKKVDITEVADTVRSIANSATAGMKDLAAAHNARVARLTTVRERLQKSSKTPPATLQKLNQSISSANAVAQKMGALADRITARPTVDPADLAVFGRVLDAKGAPASGLYVRLSDSAGSLNAGSRVKTQATGDFSLVLKQCELPEAAQGLLIVVEDSGGARLTASNPVTPKAGRPVYVDIALPGGK